MIRTLGGIVVGIAVAIILMMIIEAIGNQIYPPPAGIDYTSPDASAFMPFRSLIFPVIGWFVATLVGGWVAIWVSAQSWTSWPIAAAGPARRNRRFPDGPPPGVDDRRRNPASADRRPARPAPAAPFRPA